MNSSTRTTAPSRRLASALGAALGRIEAIINGTVAGARVKG
ncbi:hypothetical protein [Sorangium sp. So ce1000]